tara:strand:+ start:1999 stop:2409 length:411 start_codon:yes stop_codon:yes gene_type:complete
MLKIASVDQAQRLCLKDPVRPSIPYNWRVDPPNRIVYYIENAVLCAAFCEDIPTTEEELLKMKPGPIVICYTVWSSLKGQGRAIVNQVLNKAKEIPHTTRYITLSPKTEMAKTFHLNNGAILLQENETTNNFEYGV